jgi:hypothetical protein
VLREFDSRLTAERIVADAAMSAAGEGFQGSSPFI